MYRGYEVIGKGRGMGSGKLKGVVWYQNESEESKWEVNRNEVKVASGSVSNDYPAHGGNYQNLPRKRSFPSSWEAS